MKKICSFFLTDIEAVDPLWIFKTTLFLLYLICNFCFHLLAFEIFSYSRLAEVSDGCHTSSWPLKSRHTGIECVGEHQNTKVREKEISQIWHGGREGGNNSWSLICTFCMWRLLKWQQEKRFVTERVNKQESNRGGFVTLSAAAEGGRWRLNELERFVLPSGCYHCYKCSGPHNHTLSPLNSPNTARHPHTHISFDCIFRAFCCHGNRNTDRLCGWYFCQEELLRTTTFLTILRLILEYLEPHMLSYTTLASWSSHLLCAIILHRCQLFRIVCVVIISWTLTECPTVFGLSFSLYVSICISDAWLITLYCLFV